MLNLADLEKMGEQWQAYITNDLGLDSNDPIHEAAAYALRSSRHLFKRGKKTTAKLYGKELDKLTEQAWQLSNTINSLHSTDKDCLAYSLRGQHDINVRNSDQIDQFIQALAQAAQSVKNVNIDPITDGYYNQFLYHFVDCLHGVVLTDLKIAEEFYPSKLTEKEISKFLLDTWKTTYHERTREVAIKIIQSQLNDAGDRRNAQKAVDKHLSAIVDERINHYAKLQLRTYNQLIDNKSKSA